MFDGIASGNHLVDESKARSMGVRVYEEVVLPRSVATNSCQLLLEVGKLMQVSVLSIGVGRVRAAFAKMHYLDM